MLIFFMLVVESIIGVEVLLDGASAFRTLIMVFKMASCEPSELYVHLMSNLAPMSVMAEISLNVFPLTSEIGYICYIVANFEQFFCC